MRILVFGTGDYYERYKKWLVQEEILALIDNSPVKQKEVIDGKKVLPPKEAVKLPYDKIIILSFYVKEMKRQLTELGVDQKDILHFFDLHDFLSGRKPVYPAKISKKAKEILEDGDKKRDTVLLLSTDLLRMGGPAKVLFGAGKILKNKGMSVLYASMADGELRDEIEEAGIPVIVDPNLQVSTMKEIEWIREFRLLICNTINFYVFLSRRKCSIPVIWWLHDSAFFYGGVNPARLNSISQENIKIVSVGNIPRKAMMQLAPQFEIGNLLYGTSDKEYMVCKREKPKVYFAVIGYVEQRKGQDILLRAVRQLPDAVRDSLHVYIIGGNTSAMAVSMKQELEGIPEVTMTGVLDSDEFEKMFCKIDVLICPSREDPMPAVASEAMRSAIPCIVSDSVGTAEYIREDVEGWIFRNEDVDELADKIRKCVEHKDQIKELGANARKLYEKYFSMDVFERNLLELIPGSIKGKSQEERNAGY